MLKPLQTLGFLKFMLAKPNKYWYIVYIKRAEMDSVRFKKGSNKMAKCKKEIVPTTKSGIIAALAEAGEISKKQAVAIYDRLIDLAIKGAKQEEKGFMLPALGKVKLVKRPARTGRNPMTGEKIKIKAKKVVKIVACKALKDAVLA